MLMRDRNGGDTSVLEWKVWI